MEVVRGALASLKASNGGVFLGVSTSLETGTFWSGLIDDVRIYDRVVEP